MSSISSDYFNCIKIGTHISELPKSKLPASAAFENGKYPFICSSSELRYTASYLETKPAVVMGTGGVASVHFGKNEFAYSTDTWAIRSKSLHLDTEFLFRKIQHILPDIDFRAFEGSGLKHLKKNDVKKLKIEVPVDPNVSKKILQILRIIDQTIEKTEALIAKYQLIKAGLMQDLFTRGIGADGKLRPTREQAPELYQETQIGWIPKDWTIEKCGDLFTIQLGKMLSQDFKTGIDESVYLGNKNVQWDYCDFSNLESMNFNDFEKEKYRLIQGDLLVCEGGDVGRAAIWREEITDCYYQKAIHRLRPINEQLLPHLMLRFLFYAKNAGMLTNYVSQTSIAHLTREKLAALPVFVPSAEEQEQLIIRFDAIDSKLHNESEQLIKLFKQKQGLMHDLLTGKKRVIVDECEADHV